MPAADAPFTYPHTLTCHPTGTPEAPVHPAAAGDRPCCSSNKRSLTASPWASAAGRGQPWNGVLSGEDRRARALLVRSACVAPFRARQRTGGRAEAAPAAPPARLPPFRPRAAAQGSCGGRSCDDQELGLLAVVGWADATENGRAGCAPIWASSPTCVPQPTPKNSASRVARCPPRAPLDQQSSNGVAIAPGGRALCAAASARYLGGTTRPSSSI